MVPVVLLDRESEEREVLALMLRRASLDTRLYERAKDYLSAELLSEPHIAVLAADLDDHPGTDLIHHAAHYTGAVAVIAVTSRPDIRHIVDLMNAGANDVCSRPVPSENILRWLSGQLVPGAEPIDQQKDLYRHLTRREVEVIKALLDGSRNQDIADRLGISVRTVEAHRSRIYDKLGVNSHVELIKKMNGVAE
ncbi:response regulator transcription factor [Parvularcula sp. LCG005]|uniref:response regulator transcription factor n=1 Tax=Parvularcula sp. LCG005 TaxID=3078805 RepID=UPI002943F54B|nr:LuxR C-terminal-related transcriptional regulator [Parvularcula sp. LCG005]WOI53029.1 LuxR C-terminal-related transcriptional regulator [Parvularcula sp. LCG005]WOI53043.1 LuxR C-terminal-related transcriptional regulator [Parvularcula sp. LCG005]